MKLPADKKERTKILVLVFLGAAIAVYGIVTFVVKPAMARQKERLARIEELKDDLDAAERKIRYISRDTADNERTLKTIAAMAVHSNFVLRARLGNFLLGASEQIEDCARRSGVELRSIREIGISELPAGDGARPFAFKFYTVRVQALTGAHGLARLLAALEAANPLLAVSSLTIGVQPSTPAEHNIAFDLQWPIWADPADGDTFDAMGHADTSTRTETS
jgi:hypothetical protein